MCSLENWNLCSYSYNENYIRKFDPKYRHNEKQKNLKTNLFLTAGKDKQS